MNCSKITYQSYDHRLKNFVMDGGNPDLIPETEIPRSTICYWLNNGVKEVISHEVFDQDAIDLQKRVLELEKENAELRVENELLKSTREAVGWSLESVRLPAESLKQTMLELISTAVTVISLSKYLKAVGISSSRYHAWRRREQGCELEDHSYCPHTFPTKLISPEVKTIGEMVQAKEYAHFSIRALAFHATRVGKVVASPTKWHKLIREYGWTRPRKRLYLSSRKSAFALLDRMNTGMSIPRL
jgi:hypothetical protein